MEGKSVGCTHFSVSCSMKVIFHWSFYYSTRNLDTSFGIAQS